MKQPVEHLVLMGVAGCGKTTAAINLHNALGWPVAEADDFHPEANIAKMSRGVPLTDEDRWPWLESLRAWMSEQADRGTRTIVTCSALKRSYRDLLAGAHGRVFFIHLVADENTLHERMERREGHFMPPALLPSQFADLEPLADDEDGVTVVSRATPEQTLEAILAAFETAPAAPDRSPDHRQTSPTRRTNDHDMLHRGRGAGRGPLPGPLPAGARRPRRHRDHHPPHRVEEDSPLPRPHPRLGRPRPRRRDPARRHLHGLHRRPGLDDRRRRHAHRLRGHYRQAPHRLRRRRPDRRHDPGQHLRPGAALGHGAHRLRRGHPALLRGRHRPAHPRRHDRRAARPPAARPGRHPRPGRPVRPSRPRAPAPRTAHRHRRRRREPRDDPRAGPARRRADRHHLRPALGPAHGPLGAAETHDGPRPDFVTSIFVVLLPVVLMLLRTVVETLGPEDMPRGLAHTALFLGQPIVALLITVLAAMYLFGTRLGLRADEVSARVGASLGPIAGILLIVGAGGGFKQTLVDSGIADIIAAWIEQAAVPALLAGWLVAVAVRLATGSATVATITAAGIMKPLAADMPPTGVALLVLAIGAGSVFLSHVNDAGFWLVKEYFGMSVGQTFKTWSLMETILSVTAMTVTALVAWPLGVL